MTYEEILQRMLDRVPDDIDKREGSIIFDALGPAATELAQAYIYIDTVRDTVSIDTAEGYELEELCYQIGVFRKGETQAIRKGEFNVPVPIGTRFNAVNTTFRVVERIDNLTYKLECEQAGLVGNSYVGPITIIDDLIDGLSTSLLTDVIADGVEEESDEQLRERTRKKIVSPTQDGNAAQYKDWADSYDGVGISKVFRLWNGGNTVKVAITDRTFRVADSTLVSEVQNYLDPGGLGLGNGVAPIGAKVTVTGGVAKQINISGNIVLADGYSEPEGIAQGISDYLASIVFTKNSVNYMRLAVAILDSPSIADLRDFRLNGGIADVPLVDDEVPMVNNINLTVVSA